AHRQRAGVAEQRAEGAGGEHEDAEARGLDQVLRPVTAKGLAHATSRSEKSFVQSDEKGPSARRRPTAAREAYSLFVPLGGGLRPPSEPSPQKSLRRQSRRSKVEHFHVGRRATNEDSHGPALNGPLRARASPAQPIPGGGFGGGRRGPLRLNEADGPFEDACYRSIGTDSTTSSPNAWRWCSRFGLLVRTRSRLRPRSRRICPPVPKSRRSIGTAHAPAPRALVRSGRLASPAACPGG